MKQTVPFTALLAATLGAVLGSAQQSPPLPPAGAPAPAPDAPIATQQTNSRQGTIKAFNAGPNGETDGVILNDGTVVFFPPETGEPLRATVKEGQRITFTGVSRPVASNRVAIDAQTVTANGQTFTVALPPPPPDGPGARGMAGPPPPPDGPPAPAPGGRGRGGRGPGPVVAGGPPPPPPGCPAPPPPPGPGR